MIKPKNITRISVVFAFASLLLLLTNSCHKYPEDPFLSLKRPFKRLEGTWKFTSYQINGVEHIHDFDIFLSPKTLAECAISLHSYNKRDGWYEINDLNGGSVPPFASSYEFRHYIIEDNSSTLLIISNATTPYAELWKGTTSGSALASKWNIRELYGKDLHISFNNIDIYFKKQ